MHSPMNDVPDGDELPPESAATEPAFVQPPATPQPVSPPPEPLVFTGSGNEYFRIWIVNLALTMATLGIYSAWAKVRRLQYFYRHMRLAGAGFDYHGNPIAILKGRIIALILFGLYTAAGYVNIWMGIGIFAALAAVLPWLFGRSLRFRLHNSSYRGIRFRFHGTTAQAYWVFLALPIFTVLSLLTLGPFWHHRLKRYQFSNAAYGRSRLSTDAAVGEFYVTYVLAVFMFIGLLIVFVGVVMAITAVAMVAGRPLPDQPPVPGGPEVNVVTVIGFAIGFLVYVMIVIAVQAVTTARIQNECWNAAKLDRHRFVSRMSARRLFGILLTNLLGTVATLGLFRPFAQVRLARYVASTFTLVPAAGFDTFIAAEFDDVSAVGEETTDLFDFDIAF